MSREEGNTYYLTEDKWKKSKPTGAILSISTTLLKQHPSFIPFFHTPKLGQFSGFLCFSTWYSHIASPLRGVWRQRARTTVSVSFKLFPNISSFHSLVNSNMCALISWKRKSKIYSFQMLDLDKCDIPHFHETLKINMSLMIANETVGSYLHRIIKGQNTTNIVFIRHSSFHVYLGFDTLILASRFRHLVSPTYRGHNTLIIAPRFRHLVSLV